MQIAALDVLHYQIMCVAVLVDVISPDDIRVVQFGGGASFDAEAFQIGGVGNPILRQHLNCYLAFHERVLSQVNLAHAALAEQAEQLVLAKHESLMLASQQLVCLPLREQIRLDQGLGLIFLFTWQLAAMFRSKLAEELIETFLLNQLATFYKI